MVYVSSRIVWECSTSVQQMQIQKQRTQKSSNPTLQQLIQQHPSLIQYFSKQSNDPCALAIQLMLEAIQNRNKKSQPHYHVQYVKPKRMLTQSQAKQITPKVTQVRHLVRSPTKIYGKPKAIINENDNYQYATYLDAKPVQVEHAFCVQPAVNSQKNILVPASNEEGDDQDYLSPKIKAKPKKIKQLPQPTKNYKLGAIKPQLQASKSGGQLHTWQKESRRQCHSPQVLRVKQNYEHVQSRIKGLIERDKQNRKIERMMQQQNSKLDKLQQRQQRLLQLQRQQRRLLGNTSYASQSDSCQCPSATDQEINQRLMWLAKDKQPQVDYHQELYRNLAKLKDKSYKINTNPVYAISSSSQSSLGSSRVH